jgi:hypothetical protein
MSPSVLRIAGLPSGAVEAAAAFYGEWVGRASDLLEGGNPLAIVMGPAPYDHTDWRRAAARDLARSAAPARVNIVAGDDEAAIAATLAFLECASGVTGQYLPLARQCSREEVS